MPKLTRHASALLALSLLLAACGGGGGGGGDVGGGGPFAPETVTYDAVEAVYRTDTPVPPLVPEVTGGTPTSWSVAPAFPPGLELDPQSGVISGNPEAPAESTAYTVTCGNDVGQATTSLTLEIRWVEHKSLARQEELDEDDLRHFLIRTHWAATDEKLEAVQAAGLEAFVDGMLVFPEIGTTQWETDAAELLKDEDDPTGDFPSHTDLKRWWLQLMKDNENPFQEVLAFHWHDHFATSSEVLGGGRNYYMKKHVDLLRSGGIGNVRTFLIDLSRDWAMLWWLDGNVNRKGGPNENYAREFWELFTLGVEADYTQEEIVEAARAFTGWRDVVLNADTGLRQMVFEPTRHDDLDKTFFGVTIPGQNENDDFEAVVDITMQNRPVAEWLVKSLLEGFCCPDPDPVLVEQLAQVMRDEGWEIAPVLKALFLSEAFFSSRARGAFVKGPMEHAMGFMRATGLRVRVNELQSAAQRMGHVPTQPPTVNGWPGGPMWLSAQGMVDRANLLQTAISNSRSLEEQTAHDLDLRALLPLGSPTSLEVVDRLAERLGLGLEEEERTTLAHYLDTHRNSDGSVEDSPFDANDPDMVDERIRGVLYILGQHPAYMVR